MKNTKGEPIPDDVWPIAGEFLHEGRTLDPEQTRLRNSESHADAEKEGLRLLINGGIHEKVKQRALIEFICDRKRTGLEGEETAEKKQKQSTVRTSLARARNSNNDTRDGDGKDGQGGDKDEDGGDGSGGDDEPLPDPDAGKSLQLISYEQTSIGKDKEEVGTLRLEWRTKYACEDIKDIDPAPPKKSRGWGFFTWFIIVYVISSCLFLVATAPDVLPVPFCSSLRTSSSARGSTTAGTALEVGICCPMATPYAMCHISSKNGLGMS